jgi:peroxiredoxin
MMFNKMFNNMFGMKKITKESTMPEVPKAQTPTVDNSRDFYRIGVTNDGRTILTVISDGGFALSLWLNSAGVRQMIRLLEATLSEDDDERTNS